MLEGFALLGLSLFSTEPRARWVLPKRLKEISGLAVTPDGRVLGHDDERAVIYELDLATGDTLERVRLGHMPARDDFEGLAISHDSTLFLVTSAGLIHAFQAPSEGGQADFDVFDAGLAGKAEIEGAAWDAPGERLLLACKVSYSPALQGALVLYAWSPATPGQHARPWLTVPAYPLAQAVGARAFHPSGVEVDPRTGRLVIVASAENAIVELDPEGRLLAARRLGPGHRQPEGVAILPDGALLIADEARGGVACLTCYGRLEP